MGNGWVVIFYYLREVSLILSLSLPFFLELASVLPLILKLLRSGFYWAFKLTVDVLKLLLCLRGFSVSSSIILLTFSSGAVFEDFASISFLFFLLGSSKLSGVSFIKPRFLVSY